MQAAIETAVIGHTGFVGSTLMRTLPGAQGYNSRTVAQAEGTIFGTLYCAAAPGSMVRANKMPAQDAAHIDSLIASLHRMRAERFILISTIAVLERFDGGYTETHAAYQTSTPYGLHRRRLEVAVRRQFPNCLIVRLPALFGPGLAKNFLFDLINPLPSMLNTALYDTLITGLSARLRAALAAIYTYDPQLGFFMIDRTVLAACPERMTLTEQADRLGVNAVRFHHHEARYQFYQMDRLKADIDLALDAGLDVIHLAPPPLQTATVYTALKGGDMPHTTARLHREDMRTAHAGLWGMTGAYNRKPEDVLTALTAFYRTETEN